MRVLRVCCALVLLTFAGAGTGCRKQEGGGGSASAVRVPEHFEVHLDALFDLAKPSSLTPELLESKVEALALVPDEKLCRPVQVGGESTHRFSAEDAPRQHPVYTIFKSNFHPDTISVVWQGQAMARIECVYPATKDHEVPASLLKDISLSLETGYSKLGAPAKYEWLLKDYRVTAEYTGDTGEGEPTYLVTVRNKRVPQPVESKVPSPVSAIAPAGAASGSGDTIDLDQLFDWRDPAAMSVEQFDAKIDALEKTVGQKLFRRSSENVHSRCFGVGWSGRQSSCIVFGGQYRAEGYIVWKSEGAFSSMQLGNLKTLDGVNVEPLEMIAKLDQRFGRAHATEGRVSVWNTPSFRAIFFKFSNGTGYAFRITPPNGGALTAMLAQGDMEVPAPPTPAAPARAKDFKLRLAQVNGLLISPLASGEEAGMVTKMTLSAAFNLGDRGSVLRFNQDVGGDMRQSLNEVFKLASHRHPDLPLGHTIEIGFEDKYVDKDGPSAAVACALLVESALTGKTWDPLFAVTGDLNADGSVQPIGGVRAKIRGATKGRCKLVAVPTKNEKAVADTLLLDGPGPLVGITVFGIKTFDDAMRLAQTERPEALTRALADFDAMRTVIQRDPRQATALLRTPHAVQRLQALYAAAPDCYSAKYLLGYAQGRVARTLSLGGSIEAAQNSAQAILYAVKNDVANVVDKLKPDEVGNALSKLRSLRPSMDQRVWPFVDGVMDLGEVLRGAILSPVRSGARYQDLMRKVEKSAASAESAMSLLMNSAEVREELGS